MEAKAEKGSDLSVDQQSDLESAFLVEELFTGEFATQEEGYLTALVAESPFLNAFDNRPGRLVEPDFHAEAPDEEGLEADWEDGTGEYFDDQSESEVFGTNDMDSVSDSLALPHRWICRLDIEYEITPWNSTRRLTGTGRGTGTLISPCHILTAAHNLTGYDPVGRNFLRATRIRVTAAHDGSRNPPVATVEADLSKSHVHPRWVVSRRVSASGAGNDAGEVATNRYDYAVLALTSAIGRHTIRTSGDPLGYWADQGSGGLARFERMDPRRIIAKPVSVSGYVHDGCVVDVRRARSKPGIPLGSSLTASGQIRLTREGRTNYIGRSMAHDVDTCGGQSGAPVWLLEDGKYYLVGIHTGGVALSSGGRTNHAVRVTKQLIREVSDWMTQSPCPSTSAAREIEELSEGETFDLDESTEEEFEDWEWEDEEESGDDQSWQDESDTDRFDRGLSHDDGHRRDESDADRIDDESYDDEFYDDEFYARHPETDAENTAIVSMREDRFERYSEQENPYAQLEWYAGGQSARDEDRPYSVSEEHGSEEAVDAETSGREVSHQEGFPGEENFHEIGQGNEDTEIFEMEQSPAVPAHVAQFAATLGKEWARRRNGSPAAEKITGWLLKDYQDTLIGSRLRFRKYPGDLAIGRAWMTSRDEQMKFKTLSSSAVKDLHSFQPPAQPITLVTDQSLVKGSDKAPVAPIILRFVQVLHQQYPGFLDVSTYRNHGGGKFRNRGLSLDLFLKGTDNRGFYPAEEAKKCLRAVHRTAAITGVEWRVIYNDFSVADSINRETGKAHVIFVGKARSQNQTITGLNWHGPQPLILHFHLDLAPGTGAPTTSSSTTGHGALPAWLSEIVKSGVLTLQAALAMFLGQRDVVTLTNMIFYARHPELPVGYTIKSHEKQLAANWKRIQDDVVKPILRRLSEGSVSIPTPTPIPLPSSTSVETSPRVLAEVEKYRSLAEAAAARYGVDSALILGVIAAESGGSKNLVAKSGYTGLMQSDKGEAQKQPEVSIDSGTKKLRNFRITMEGILKAGGRRYDQLPQIEQLRMLVLAYNAGPVTVAKALQYATEAGNPERWLDAENYKRALYFTGAYSLSQAEGSCLKGVSEPERSSRKSEAKRIWLQTRLKSRVAAEKARSWRTLADPQPWASVMPTLPTFLVCAIDFKHRNAFGYSDKILAYRNAFLRPI